MVYGIGFTTEVLVKSVYRDEGLHFVPVTHGQPWTLPLNESPWEQCGRKGLERQFFGVRSYKYNKYNSKRLVTQKGWLQYTSIVYFSWHPVQQSIFFSRWPAATTEKNRCPLWSFVLCSAQGQTYCPSLANCYEAWSIPGFKSSFSQLKNHPTFGV